MPRNSAAPVACCWRSRPGQASTSVDSKRIPGNPRWSSFPALASKSSVQSGEAIAFTSHSKRWKVRQTRAARHSRRKLLTNFRCSQDLGKHSSKCKAYDFFRALVQRHRRSSRYRTGEADDH
jgi:hypothetical protein